MNQLPDEHSGDRELHRLQARKDARIQWIWVAIGVALMLIGILLSHFVG